MLDILAGVVYVRSAYIPTNQMSPGLYYLRNICEVPLRMLPKLDLTCYVLHISPVSKKSGIVPSEQAVGAN